MIFTIFTSSSDVEVDEEGSYDELDGEEYFPSDGENYDDDDQDSLGFNDDEDTKSKFSNCSMTSSVIRRTEGYGQAYLKAVFFLSTYCLYTIQVCLHTQVLLYILQKFQQKFSIFIPLISY